jgi:outer membrane PBP1 activator LpoA protein
MPLTPKGIAPDAQSTHRAARSGLVAAAILALAGCAQVGVPPEDTARSQAQARVEQAISASDPAALARARMELSRTLSGTARAEQQLTAIETAIDAGELALARELYQQSDTREQWSRIDSRRAALAEGIGQWAAGDLDRAIRTITRLPLPLSPATERRRLSLLAVLHAEKGDTIRAARLRVALDERLSDTVAERNRARIWSLVSSLDSATLTTARENATDPVFAGWLDLARQYRQHPGRLANWARENADHPAVTSGFVDVLGASGPMRAIGDLQPPARGPIAVLLPEDERYRAVTEEIRRGIDYALEASSLGGRRELIHLDSGTTALAARAALEQATNRGAAIVIGPLLKEQVAAIDGLQSGGPLVIALNTPRGGQSLPSGVISFSLSPEQDARDVAARMILDGHRRVGVIASGSSLGRRAQRAFVDEFTLRGGEILIEATFEPGQTDFSGTLKRMLRVRSPGDGPFQPEIREDMDAVFVAASARELALVAPQLDYFGADELPRYSLGAVYSGNRDPERDQDKDRTIIPVSPMLLAGTAGPEHPLRPTYERAQLAGPLPRLFAFGADAAMLATHLDTLLDGGRLSGLTGELTLDPLGLVERRPDWGRFRDGVLHPIDDSGHADVPAKTVTPDRPEALLPTAASPVEGTRRLDVVE